MSFLSSGWSIYHQQYSLCPRFRQVYFLRIWSYFVKTTFDLAIFTVDSLVPAGDTEFSKDASFGYKASNLCDVCLYTSIRLKIYIYYNIFIYLLNMAY